MVRALTPPGTAVTGHMEAAPPLPPVPPLLVLDTLALLAVEVAPIGPLSERREVLELQPIAAAAHERIKLRTRAA